MQAIAVAADLERWELEPTGDRTPQEHASRDTVAVSAEVPVSDRVRELMRRTAEYEASLECGHGRTGPLGPEAGLSQQRSAAVSMPTRTHVYPRESNVALNVLSNVPCDVLHQSDAFDRMLY